MAALTSFSAASYQRAFGRFGHEGLWQATRSDSFDPVAVSLGRLSGYHVVDTAGVSTYGVCGKLYTQVGSKLVLCLNWPFGRMRVAPMPQRRLHQQATIVAANAAAGMKCHYVSSRPNRPELLWQPMSYFGWLQ
jgi:hypothetical protein